MEVLIIEDEIRNANRLKALVLEINTEVVFSGVLESVADSIEWFEKNEEPDLILMDIRLSDGLCFEIFSACKITAPVIFTTAYDEYAIRAFKVNSIDYLLKPIDKSELTSAIGKLGQIAKRQQAHSVINNLVDVMKKQGTVYRSRFLIPINDGYKTVVVQHIDYIYSEFKTSHLVLQDKSVQAVIQTMDELEEQLDPNVFFRANRQHLINVDAIKAIHNYFNGKLKVVITGHPDVEVLISREKASLFKQWLDK